MKIKEIEVADLFGLGKNIRLSLHGGTTIVHGLNGVGKTTILKLTNSVLNGDIRFLLSTRFSSIVISLFQEDGPSPASLNTISVVKSEEKTPRNFEDRLFPLPLYYEFSYVGEPSVKTQACVSTDFAYFLFRSGLIDQPEEFLVSASRNERIYRHRLMDGRFDGADSFLLLPIKSTLSESRFRRAELDVDVERRNNFNKYCNGVDISTLFIDTDRIFADSAYSEENGDDDKELRPSFGSHSFKEQPRRISEYSAKIGSMVFDAKSIFDNYLYRQNSIMVQRLVKFLNQKESAQAANANFDPVQRKYFQYVKELNSLGLYEYIDTNSQKQEPIQNQTAKRVLKLYSFLHENDFCDAFEQNGSFSSEKIQNLLFLQEMLNERNAISGKKVTFSPNQQSGLVYSTMNGDKVPDVTLLSSGEQQDFILFYELLFECPNGSIVFIDEPEISLHAAWQSTFIQYIEKIGRRRNLQFLVSTHSPVIIGDHWDITEKIS